MGVHKFSPRHGFLTRIMEEKSAAVRKDAAATIRKAEEQIMRSEEIVSQSVLIVERAERLLDETGRLRHGRRDSQNREIARDGESPSSPVMENRRDRA